MRILALFVLTVCLVGCSDKVCSPNYKTVISMIEKIELQSEISEELYNYASTSPEYFANTLKQAQESMRQEIIQRIQVLEKEECATAK